jgi:hypothetical protein
MNLSKRTWIIIAIAILGVLGALASLYFEKEAIINELVNVPDGSEIIHRVKPSKLVVEKEPIIETFKNENDAGNI